MGKRTVITCIILALAGTAVLFATIGLGTSLHSRSREKARDRQFHERLYSDFLSQLERRDKIDDLAAYNKEKRDNATRYEESGGKPQVVRGTVKPPGGQDLGVPLRMALKAPAGPSVRKTVVDEQLRFAFPAVEPGEYELTLSETSACPGVRLEKVVVAHGEPVPGIVIDLGDAVIDVTVTDTAGHAVAGAQVTVGKSCGGLHSSLFTWRKGLTDSAGKFVAESLVDGQYVVAVYTQLKNGSTVVPVAASERKEVSITMSHDNF